MPKEGVYADTKQNRALNRVGKPYGTAVLNSAKVRTENILSREEETRRRRREKDKRKEEKLRRRERDIQKQRDELARRETDLLIRERQQSIGVPSRFHDFMRDRRDHHERENREHRDQESARARKRPKAESDVQQSTPGGGSPKKRNKSGLPMCRYKDKCRNKDCQFSHPQSKKSELPKCWFGDKCWTKDCKFSHPQTAPSNESRPKKRPKKRSKKAPALSQTDESARNKSGRKDQLSPVDRGRNSNVPRKDRPNRDRANNILSGSKEHVPSDSSRNPGESHHQKPAKEPVTRTEGLISGGYNKPSRKGRLIDHPESRNPHPIPLMSVQTCPPSPLLSRRRPAARSSARCDKGKRPKSARADVSDVAPSSINTKSKSSAVQDTGSHVDQLPAKHDKEKKPSEEEITKEMHRCKKFLTHLLKLANEKPEAEAKRERRLIQELIDGTLGAYQFTHKFRCSQFLTENIKFFYFTMDYLPHLQHSLACGELSIDGIRAPTLGVVKSFPRPRTEPFMEGSKAGTEAWTNDKNEELEKVKAELNSLQSLVKKITKRENEKQNIAMRSISKGGIAASEEELDERIDGYRHGENFVEKESSENDGSEESDLYDAFKRNCLDRPKDKAEDECNLPEDIENESSGGSADMDTYSHERIEKFDSEGSYRFDDSDQKSGSISENENADGSYQGSGRSENEYTAGSGGSERLDNKSSVRRGCSPMSDEEEEVSGSLFKTKDLEDDKSEGSEVVETEYETEEFDHEGSDRSEDSESDHDGENRSEVSDHEVTERSEGEDEDRSDVFNEGSEGSEDLDHEECDGSE